MTLRPIIIPREDIVEAEIRTREPTVIESLGSGPIGFEFRPTDYVEITFRIPASSTSLKDIYEAIQQTTPPSGRLIMPGAPVSPPVKKRWLRRHKKVKETPRPEPEKPKLAGWKEASK